MRRYANYFRGRGAIATELARSLICYTQDIRLVSRHPLKVNPTDEVTAADLLNRDEVGRAVEGSEVVYVTIGFAYDIKVWQFSWPKLIENVIGACRAHGSKLVFFDNIYMYDANPLTGIEWIEAIAFQMGVKPAYRILPKYMVALLGWLVPIMKEMKEMMYQYDRDYLFDSSKFEKQFGWVATPYPEGIKESVKAFL